MKALRLRFLASSAILVALPGVVVSVAAAQEAAPASSAPVQSAQAAPAAKTSGDTIEEITVTARRVGENLQKGPVAVTAVTAADIQNRQIESLKDVAANTPSLTIAQNNA